MLTQVTLLLIVYSDTVHRLHKGVVYIRNIMWFLGTCVNVILFKSLRKAQPSLCHCSQDLCVQQNMCRSLMQKFIQIRQ